MVVVICFCACMRDPHNRFAITTIWCTTPHSTWTRTLFHSSLPNCCTSGLLILMLWWLSAYQCGIASAVVTFCICGGNILYLCDGLECLFCGICVMNSVLYRCLFCGICVMNFCAVPVRYPCWLTSIHLWCRSHEKPSSHSLC